MINLNDLVFKDKIEVNEEVTFPENYQTKSISSVGNVKAEGFVRLNDADEYMINIQVKGKANVLDSRTNEIIIFPLNFEIDDQIDDSCINLQNMLDLRELLWQNIVLEVPISYTNSENKNIKGDNWEMVTEEKSDAEIDPRMQKLYDLFKGGEK